VYTILTEPCVSSAEVQRQPLLVPGIGLISNAEKLCVSLYYRADSLSVLISLVSRGHVSGVSREGWMLQHVDQRLHLL
jgi:hypothetical protein